MSQAKVVLISCGEKVYPQEWLMNVISEVVDGIKKLDLDLEGTYVAMDEASAVYVSHQLDQKRFDLLILHLVSWHITPNLMQIIRDYKQVPMLVWATGGRTDANAKLHSPAAPAAITALIPMMREMGFKYKAIYEQPDEPHHFKEVENFAKVAYAFRRVRNSRIGFIGYADMGLYTCAYDKAALYNKLGIDAEDYFSYEIGKLMDEAPQEKISDVVHEIRQKVTFDSVISEKILDKVARLYYVMKYKVKERGLVAISIKCVDGVTKFMGVNPCMAQSLLANKDLSVICECDAYGLVTNVMMSMLTGQTSTFMENYEFFKDEILIGTCGFMPFDFADGEIRAKSSNLGDFFVGISNISKVKTGTMTFARLFKSGDRYKMFLSKGEAQAPMKWIELGWEEPTPDFPSVLLKLEMSVQHYMENVPGQHIILTCGDHVEQMKTLCALMEIEVVC